jgi:hypothetical protein
MPNPILFATREGDVLLRDTVANFHVWVVTRAGATDPDPQSTPFTADSRVAALEEALRLAVSTGGVVFSIDRAGVWTEVPRLRKRT